MTDTVTTEREHFRDLLRYSFEGNADWRRRKAEEYPDDRRNLEAAEIFDRLLATVDKVPDNLIDAYAAVFNRDGDAPYKASEVEQEHLRSVGFHSAPEDAAEFLREYLDAVEGEESPTLRAVT